MKRLILPVLFLLCISLPAFAVFCSKCGSEAKSNAVYCAKCGSQLEQAASGSAASGPSKISTVSVDDLFAPVNEYETFVKTSNFITCIAKSPEFKIKFDGLLKELDSNSSLSDFDKKMVELARKKFALVQLLMDAWGRKINGPFRITAEAAMYKVSYGIERYNEFISAFKASKDIASLSKMEKELEISMTEYKVTSKYLQIENCWVAKDEPIWVAKIENNKARVLHMGESTIGCPIGGWVSVDELKKRTTWKPSLN